jgi:hypothetical protein
MEEKMLFNSEGGNLFEVLQTGGGPNGRTYLVELWNKEINKWVKTGIDFTIVSEARIKKDVIQVAKEKVENSIFA